MNEINCPDCLKNVELPWVRWDFQFICPSCRVFIYVDFDFTYDADSEDQEEYDYYEPRIIFEAEYQDNIVRLDTEVLIGTLKNSNP